MSRVVAFAPSGDDALATAGVVARLTAARLETESHEVDARGDVPRQELESALSAADGLAAFSHGRSDALLDGARAAMLDRGNIHLLAGRWAWMFACRTAHELAALALDAGASCFAGFDVALHVGWTPADLPASIQPDFERLVTEVPSRLAAGERGLDAILDVLCPLVDRILDHCATHADAPPGIEITAQQMLGRLVVRSAPPFTGSSRCPPCPPRCPGPAGRH